MDCVYICCDIGFVFFNNNGFTMTAKDRESLRDVSIWLEKMAEQVESVEIRNQIIRRGDVVYRAYVALTER